MLNPVSPRPPPCTRVPAFSACADHPASPRPKCRGLPCGWESRWKLEGLARGGVAPNTPIRAAAAMLPLGAAAFVILATWEFAGSYWLPGIVSGLGD